MIDKLKFLIDESEDKPKVKKILLMVAELKEESQEPMLQLIEMILNAKHEEDSKIMEDLDNAIKKDKDLEKQMDNSFMYPNEE